MATQRSGEGEGTSPPKDLVRRAMIGVGDLPVKSVACFSMKLERIFVIGRYRLLLLQPGEESHSIVASGHLYDLRRLDVERSSMTFEFVERRKMALEKLSESTIVEVLEAFFASYAIVTFGWPDEDRCEYSLSWPVELCFTKPSPRFAGFREMYVAYASFFHSPVSSVFVEALGDSVAGECLDLSPYLDGSVDLTATRKGSSGPLRRRGDNVLVLDLQPVAAALQRNKYFRRLIVEAPLQPSCLTDLLPAFFYNRALTHLQLSHARVTVAELDSFVDTILGLDRRKVESALVNFDFSGNHFGDFGAKSLVALLKTNVVESLNLAENGCTCSGMAEVLQALATNPLTDDSLQLLDLSHNTLGGKGTTALREFLASKTWSRLSHLLLAGTKLRVPVFVRSVSSFESHVPVLAYLELGGNSVEPPHKKKSPGWETPAEFAILLSCISRLEYLGLSKTGISAKLLTWLTDELLRKRRCGRVHRSERDAGSATSSLDLNIANNSSSLGGDLQSLRTALIFSPETRLTSIFVHENHMGSDCLVALLESLGRNRTVRRLSLGQNYRFSIENAEAVAKDLGRLLLDIPYLETLSLKGDGGAQYYFGEYLGHLLDRLRTHRHLKSLDVRKNMMGSVGARGLERLVASQTSLLETLFWDDNHFSVEEIKRVISEIEFNIMLLEVEFPYTDASRSRPKRERTVREFRATLRGYLNRNKDLKTRNLPPPYEIAIGKKRARALRRADASETAGASTAEDAAHEKGASEKGGRQPVSISDSPVNAREPTGTVKVYTRAKGADGEEGGRLSIVMDELAAMAEEMGIVAERSDDGDSGDNSTASEREASEPAVPAIAMGSEEEQHGEGREDAEHAREQRSRHRAAPGNCLGVNLAKSFFLMTDEDEVRSSRLLWI